jgi:hypothetical protein
VLAQRVVAASWRLARAERIEAELFAEQWLAGTSLGVALARDGNGARAFDTLLRYRGVTLAELWRALRTLKALQAEQAAQMREVAAAAATPSPISQPNEVPIEPESRGNPDGIAPLRCADEPAPAPVARVSAPTAPVLPGDRPIACRKQPDERETCGNAGDCGRPSDRAEPWRGAPSPAEPAPPLRMELVQRGGAAALLAGTALVPTPGAGRRPAQDSGVPL